MLQFQQSIENGTKTIRTKSIALLNLWNGCFPPKFHANLPKIGTDGKDILIAGKMPNGKHRSNNFEYAQYHRESSF